MMKQRHSFRNLTVGTLLALAATASLAQGYPSKPVHIMVPFAPGSATDMLGCIIGAKLTEMWGQSVIIENRAGAGSKRFINNIGSKNPARIQRLPKLTSIKTVSRPTLGIFPFRRSRSSSRIRLHARLDGHTGNSSRMYVAARTQITVTHTSQVEVHPNDIAPPSRSNMPAMCAYRHFNGQGGKAYRVKISRRCLGVACCFRWTRA